MTETEENLLLLKARELLFDALEENSVELLDRIVNPPTGNVRQLREAAVS